MKEFQQMLACCLIVREPIRVERNDGSLSAQNQECFIGQKNWSRGVMHSSRVWMVRASQYYKNYFVGFVGMY
jgi:hypothetical protein